MERPILFSAPMVLAILDGKKTQTRRVAKLNDVGRVKEAGSPRNWHCDDPDAVNACPYGCHGDTLWVRETWAPARTGGYDAREDGGLYWYRASDAGICDGPWKPSIFMPRDACRIRLEITGVRLERLQDISEDDSKAEGVTQIPECQGSYTYAYAQLWDAINKKRGYPWASNPWVWVVSFERRQDED